MAKLVTETIAEAIKPLFILSAWPRRTAKMQDDVTASPERPDRILRLRVVLDRTGLSRSTVYRKIQEGTFPRQIALGARSAGWRESAVSAWMQGPMTYRAET